MCRCSRVLGVSARHALTACARARPPRAASAPAAAGATRHAELPPDSEPQRKGISCERTFKAVSSPEALHGTVSRGRRRAGAVAAARQPFLITRRPRRSRGAAPLRTQGYDDPGHNRSMPRPRPLFDRTSLPLAPQLKALAEHLAADMAEEGIEGRTITLKLKAATFEVRWGRGAWRREAGKSRVWRGRIDLCQPAPGCCALPSRAHINMPYRRGRSPPAGPRRCARAP